MISAPDLLATAVAGGLATAAEVTAGTVTLEPATRSNIVHRLARGNQSVAFIKQRGAASWMDGDDPVHHEACVLRSLTDVPATLPTGSTPRLLAQSNEQALWTDAVPGTMLHLVPGAAALAVADAFGRALGRLHATPIGSQAPIAPRPWGLDGSDLPASMSGGVDGPNCGLVHRTLAHSDVRHALSSISHRWPNRDDRAGHMGITWVHGDLSGPNILVQDCATKSGPSVGFVDLEGAGLGNPNWDVATALDTLEVMAGLWGLSRTVPAAATACQVMAAFADGYWAASDIRSSGFSRGVPHPAWRCLRLITRAWQAAAGADQQAATAEHAVQVDPVVGGLVNAAKHAAQIAVGVDGQAGVAA